jgi:hypothetical protein
MTRRLAIALTVLALGACTKHVQSGTTPVPPITQQRSICSDASMQSMCSPAREVAPMQEAARPVRVDTNLKSPHALDNSAA